MNRISNSYDDHQELNRLKHSAHFDLAPTHKSDSPDEGENNHHQGPNHSAQGTEKNPKSNDDDQSKTPKNSKKKLTQTMRMRMRIKKKWTKWNMETRKNQ